MVPTESANNMWSKQEESEKVVMHAIEKSILFFEINFPLTLKTSKYFDTIPEFI